MTSNARLLGSVQCQLLTDTCFYFTFNNSVSHQGTFEKFNHIGLDNLNLDLYIFGKVRDALCALREIGVDRWFGLILVSDWGMGSLNFIQCYYACCGNSTSESMVC